MYLVFPMEVRKSQAALNGPRSDYFLFISQILRKGGYLVLHCSASSSKLCGGLGGL